MSSWGAGCLGAVGTVEVDADPVDLVTQESIDLVDPGSGRRSTPWRSRRACVGIYPLTRSPTLIVDTGCRQCPSAFRDHAPECRQTVVSRHSDCHRGEGTELARAHSEGEGDFNFHANCAAIRRSPVCGHGNTVEGALVYDQGQPSSRIIRSRS